VSGVPHAGNHFGHGFSLYRTTVSPIDTGSLETLLNTGEHQTRRRSDVNSKRTKTVLVIVAAGTTLANIAVVSAQQTPPIRIELGGTPTVAETVVYSKTEEAYFHDDRDGDFAPTVAVGDDLHLLRAGRLTSFDYSYAQSLYWTGLTGPAYILEGSSVAFYENDSSDWAYIADGDDNLSWYDFQILYAHRHIATIALPDIVVTEMEYLGFTRVLTVSYVVPDGTDIHLPKDVWMIVMPRVFPDVGSGGTCRFPFTRGVEVGESHEINYISPGWGGRGNFPDLGPANRHFVVRVEADESDTPAGSDVLVEPEPDVALTFSNVSASGVTTVTTSTMPPEPPTGFEVLGTFYDIETSAEFNGSVEVCLDYDDSGLTPEQENALQLMHWDGSAWGDITTVLDTVGNVICGETSSFSVFAVLQQLPHPAQEGLDALINSVTGLSLASRSSRASPTASTPSWTPSAGPLKTSTTTTTSQRPTR
jgi:hypothetical protein